MSIILPNPPDQPGDGAGLSLELSVQRQATTAFIKTQPVIVTLTPQTKSKTSSGGYTWVKGTPRAAQVMRLVEPGQPTLPYQGSNGQIRQTEFMLMGEWDSQLGQFDIFELDDRNWEVAELYHFNGYERRAAVIKHG